MLQNKQGLIHGKELSRTFAGEPVFIRREEEDYLVHCKGVEFAYSTYVAFKRDRNRLSNTCLGYTPDGKPCYYREYPNNRVAIGCLKDSFFNLNQLLLEIRNFIRHDKNN